MQGLTGPRSISAGEILGLQALTDLGLVVRLRTTI
jgi:hypothetical protein